MVQMDNTIEALRKQGISCTKTSDPQIDLSTYDLVHIFHVNFYWVNDIVNRCIELGKPYVISAIFYPKVYDNTFEEIKRFVDHSKATILLSDIEEMELRNLTKCDPTKLEVIPNGVDKTLFTRGRDKKGKRIITVGRVEVGKGQDLIIESAIKLGLEYWIVGDCTKLDAKTRVEFGKVGVRFFGEISQKRLVELLHMSSVYICPSLSERQSLGVLEAAACGLPIVDSIYNRGSGLLPSSKIIDPKNPSAVQDALLAQLRADDNQDYVPTWEGVAKKIIEVYERE